MHTKDSYLGNTCRQTPRSFASNLPQKRGFDLCHQYVKNQVGCSTDSHGHPEIRHGRYFIRNKNSAVFSPRIHREQVQQSPDIATNLEYLLFMDAASKEYVNQETLIQQLQTQLNMLNGTKGGQQHMDSSITSTSKTALSSGLLHTWSNGSKPKPAFQKVAGSIFNATDYCAVITNNKYGVPTGGLSHASIVHEPVSSPDGGSSTTCADMDVLCNFPVSGGGSNLEARSKSISSYFPQQHANDLEMDLIKYTDCSGTIQENESMGFITTMGKSLQSEFSNLMIPQPVSREILEVSNLFPGLSSSSGLEDIRQYQPQKLDSQQTFRHFTQPYELCVNTSLAQSISCFVDQGEQCCHMLGRKTLKQPQLPTKFVNGDEQFTSEILDDLFGLDGGANVNSCNSSEVSVEHIVLLGYFDYKSLNNVPGDNGISYIKYLHSTICTEGKCTCERYIKVLLHYNSCQSNDCPICRPWKLSRVTDNFEHHLEFPCNMFMDSIVRDNDNDAPSGNSEAILPPTKRLKTGSAFEHHLEFPSNLFMDSIVRDNDIDAPSGNTEAMLPPTKRLKMESAFGDSFINSASSDRWTHKMVQPYSSETYSKVQQQSESPLSPINSEITEGNAVQFINPMLVSISIGDIKNNVIDDTFGQSLKVETFSPKGLEAGQISEEPDARSLDVMNSNNFREIGVRLNSSTHTPSKDPIAADVEDIQGRTGFNQDATNAKKKVGEPKADQEKETKSSNTTVGEIKNNVIDDTFGQTFKSETVPFKGLEAGQVSEEAEPGHDVIARSNLKEIGIRSKSSMHTLCKDPIPADVEDIEGRTGFNHARANAKMKGSEPKADQQKETKSLNTTDSEIKNNVIDDTLGQTFNSETIPSTGLEVGRVSEEADPQNHDVIDSSTLKEIGIRSNSSMHTLSKDPIPADVEDIEGRTGFNQAETNAKKKVSEPKADQEKQTKSSNRTVNIVSLTECFTRDQIMEHIMSLRKQFVQSPTEEETRNAAETCPLCAVEKHFLAPVPIYCSCCGIRIKKNANYFCRKEEEFDAQRCFCSVCYNKNSRGGCITFNGTSVSKTLLERKKNEEVDEPWVQCNKCERWQHQICALYNEKRDLDCSAEYICPVCRVKDGMHVPLPKTATFGAKDLPRTMLSDHIEKRLFERLMQERADRAKVKGSKNLDEVLAAENLSVRVVLSVDKQLSVKKQFRDIFLEENYPANFSYRSKVILLFQQIEGADVCLFVMYVQEFGSECGNPNQRCIYISYLDSVKYFRPERETMSGEALRTFVYHEILIGYLDFCKKRGFTTCYIWACPPRKGEDYILYCHPDTQKTPKNDKLRRWYHSMLRKAAEENIVVGLTNIYDHIFVPTGKCESKVTAARLPYFDGDYWSGAAMDQARNIEKESGGEYEQTLKKQVTKRTLKAMGHVNPSKGTAKDILVMQKLGQIILPAKEDFIIAHLQYVCMHCSEVIVSGKRWFCTECKNFQECERCHTAESHTSFSGKSHTLCQVLMDDIPFNTRENDIILDNGLFENRHNFLGFCQKNQYQFDTLRRAKYSSMMILYYLENPTLVTVGTTCSICCTHTVFRQSWKCEICPECTVCAVCYKERGAECHEHKLSQIYSTALCLPGNQELEQKSVLTQELLEVLQHASQCRSTKAQPCSYPNCLQIKKLFYHASRCTTRVSGGCQYCKKAWLGLTVHSRNCEDSECRVPRCMDLKKDSERIAVQSESGRRASVVESNRATLTDH